MKKLFTKFLFIIIALIGIVFLMPSANADYTIPSSISSSATWTFSSLYSNYRYLNSSFIAETSSTNQVLYIYFPASNDFKITAGNIYSQVNFYNSSYTLLSSTKFSDVGSDQECWFEFVIPYNTAYYKVSIVNQTLGSSSTSFLASWFMTDNLNIALGLNWTEASPAYQAGYTTGYIDGQHFAADLLWHDYDLDGYDDVSYNAGAATSLDGWSLLWSTLIMPFTILSIELIPGLYLGYFALIPIVFGFISWLLSLKKGK